MEARSQDALALVGVGCRFPGGIRDPEALWQLLIDGKSALSGVPSDRWHIDRYYHENPSSIARSVARRGGFVSHPKQFDASFWGFSPREAVRLDPQQRWMLESAWEACEDAGIPPSKIRGTNIGVFVGASSHDYGSLQLNDMENLDVHSNTGGTLSIISNRISYLFDLHGPSLSIDTACSSSLVAFSMACSAVWAGECDAAFAGGVNATLTPNVGIGFSKASMLSPTGECYAFDERADGYVRAEGAGVVFIKPLKQAIADGDRIYAAIRSAVVNQDGRTSSMTVPSSRRQSHLLRTALRDAGVKPQEITYVEAHGTGTPVGDPIEASAIGNVMSEGREDGNVCLMGSIKTNVGHLEPASGIAGLIKTALILDRQAVPPNRNFETPNPAIPFDDLKLKVVNELTPLTKNDQPILAAINSFGFGGTNASAVLESAAPSTSLLPDATSRTDRPYVLPISARDEVSLRSYADAYLQRLKDPAINLADFCYSAGARKDHHDLRLMVFGHSPDDLTKALHGWLRDDDPSDCVAFGRTARPSGPKAFVFTGQGSQWATMGRDLIAKEPIVAEAIDEIDTLFKRLSGWSLKAEMLVDAKESNIHSTQVAQPAIFAIQVALVRLWQSWGIQPDSVVGHSVGEVAAAWCAGIYSLEDAVALVYHRSRLQHTTGGTGRMIAAGISFAEAQAMIGTSNLEVTAINSPSLVTIGGDVDALRQLEDQLRLDGVFFKDLGLDYAFHTRQMESIKGSMLEALDFLKPQPAKIPFVSTVTGTQQSGESMDAGYWWQNVRQAVLFQQGLQTLADSDHRTFVEIGPHPSLKSSIEDCLASCEDGITICHSISRAGDPTDNLLQNVANLHFASEKIDWRSLNQSAGNFIPQPHYPWNYQEYWLDEGFDAMRLEPPMHPFLGKRLQAANPTWQFTFDLNQFAFLKDHQIWDGIVFPASGFAEIGFAVAAELFGDEELVVEDVQCIEALFIDESITPTIQVVFDAESKSFSVHSSTDKDHWQINARGRLVALASPSNRCRESVESIQRRLPSRISRESLYNDLQQSGYGFGDSFSLIDEIRFHKDAASVESLARIVADELDHKETSDYRCHPALLDACFQATHGTKYVRAATTHDGNFFLPESIRRVQLHVDHLPQEFWVHAIQIAAELESFQYDLHVIDIDGQSIADIEGFRVKKVQRQAGNSSMDDCLYQFKWESQEFGQTKCALDSPPSGSKSLDSDAFNVPVARDVKLIFVGEDFVSRELARRLKERETDVVQVQLGSKFRQTGKDEFTVVNGSVSELQQVYKQARLDERYVRQIVHCWSLSIPSTAPTQQSLLDAQRLGVTSALNLAKSLEVFGSYIRPRVSFLTRSAQCTSHKDPITGIAASPVVGFCRVANSEKSDFQWQVVDLDNQDSESEVDSILNELQTTTFESEVALRGSDRFVNRLHRIKIDDLPARTRILKMTDGPEFAIRLQMEKAGVIDDLSLHETARRTPGASDIELRVIASGINFRDVMKALGMYPGNSKDLLWFGDDFAGIVARVGKDVKDLKPGDRVCGIANYSFQSFVTIDRQMAFEMPPELSFEQAGSLPTAFVTAHLAINRIARMKTGERILIHAAAGGVGQAAIQVAQHLGLEIFATAGTPEKREWLKSMGVVHVMDSRSVRFADEIMQKTGGTGVDAVLNSLAGEFIPKSLSVLAPFGRFLEIGKVDVYGNSKLGLAALKNNISYHVIDLAQIIEERPEEVSAMLCELKERFDAKEYRPLPLRVFPISEAAEAFRFMAKGGHIGKNVLTFASLSEITEPKSLEIRACTEAGHLFKADASYLVAGGASGFGFEVAKWIVTQGGRHIVLMSRSGPNADVSAEIQQLRSDGVNVVDFRGDVTSQDDVQRALAQVRRSMPELKGVLHAAMVLDDDFIANLDEQRLSRVLNPKMLGAWNLHNATLDLPLDHFICFSSFSAVIGAPKQANYNAGNCFLDALASHRRAQGLQALTLNWGAILGAGFVQRNQKTAEYLDSMGLQGFQLDEAMKFLHETSGRNATLLAAARADWRRLGKLSKAISNLPIFSKLVNVQSSIEFRWPLQNALSAAAPDHRQEVMQSFLADQVAGVFGAEPGSIDRQVSLTTLGIDSLMAVELMNRVEAATGISVPMSGLLRGPSICELGDMLLPQIVDIIDENKASVESGKVSPVAIRLTDRDFESEVQLDQSIWPSTPVADAPEVRKIFLTGATGFFGAHLLFEMLERTNAQIICLVRAKNIAAGRQRVVENLRKYGLEADGIGDRLEVTVGDLAQERMGLSTDEFGRLANLVDVIYHNAASVNLALPYDSLHGPNVIGTREMIRFACHGKTKPIHYVSTFMVHGTDANRGQKVSESDALPPCKDLIYGYAQTKWVSEKMLQLARKRGLPVAIYRPGHVTGHSGTGTANINDLLHAVVRTCLLVGATPIQSLQLDASPVDYVSKALFELSLHRASLGQTFHLTNPDPLTDERLAHWMRNDGAMVDRIPYDHWCERIDQFVASGAEVIENLDALVQILMPRLSEGSHRGIHPRFDCTNTLTSLAGSGIQCPPADERLLSKCYAYLQNTGALPVPEAKV